MKEHKLRAEYLEPSYEEKKESTKKLFEDSCLAVTIAGKKLTMKNIREESLQIRGVALNASTFSRNEEVKRMWDKIKGKTYENYDLRDVNIGRLRKSANMASTISTYKKWPAHKLATYLAVMHYEWIQTRDTNDELNIRIEGFEEEIGKLKRELIEKKIRK